jgi:hypothetical protein
LEEFQGAVGGVEPGFGGKDLRMLITVLPLERFQRLAVFLRLLFDGRLGAFLVVWREFIGLLGGRGRGRCMLSVVRAQSFGRGQDARQA